MKPGYKVVAVYNNELRSLFPSAISHRYRIGQWTRARPSFVRNKYGLTFFFDREKAKEFARGIWSLYLYEILSGAETRIVPKFVEVWECEIKRPSWQPPGGRCLAADVVIQSTEAEIKEWLIGDIVKEIFAPWPKGTYMTEAVKLRKRISRVNVRRRIYKETFGCLF